MSRINFARLFSTLACSAVLLVTARTAYGTAVLTTNPTGFTNEVNLFPFHNSPFTDASGNTAALNGSAPSSFAIASNSSATFTVTFAHPVVMAGFDIGAPFGSSQSGFQLSNGDSTAGSSCLAQPPFQCFLGVTDNIPFTSFSITVTAPFNPLASESFILDFRYTPASVVTPEPGSGTLIAPFLIAGLAALRLKRRAS